MFITENMFSDSASSISSEAFWISANILLTKPHVVNKRLWGSKTIFHTTCKPVHGTCVMPTKVSRMKSVDSVCKSSVDIVFPELGLNSCYDEDKDSIDTRVDVILLELLPKSFTGDHAFQLVCLCFKDTRIMFYDVTPKELQQCLIPCFSYSIEILHENVVLKADCDSDSKSFLWLKETVLPQFLKWCEETNINKTNNVTSLSLISGDKYYTKYNELKVKYGKEMVKIWPECTDPSKFVYEDIAIASYLLLLWEQERGEKCLTNLQTFVDLGCGNGLLVYILAMEGHKGVGIDVRKRQIWDLYPKQVRLEEKTVTPSDLYLFPETDWIIGNHSDELTPWIPVVAARSSYSTNFFLLPCCAYNFDGTKYQRKNSSKSQYTEYLEYIKDLCEICGFETSMDRLKIPSTKRICLVGKKRKYPIDDHVDKCNEIQSIINVQSGCDSNVADKCQPWISDFKAREPTERVRNCTQLDKNLLNSIINHITEYVLNELDASAPCWSPGRSVDILELVQLIPQDKLKALKSECGGLQTLLRNNHHIFKVQNGKVQLRPPRSVEEVDIESKSKKSRGNKLKIKQKPCWFYNNHPQGCPLTDPNCSFLHVKVQ